MTPSAFSNLVNLASEKLGARTLFCSDDFFAEKENLLKSESAIFIPDKYTDKGKWMDGWESRRKRFATPYEQNDWCIVELGAAGVVQAVVIDTSHFLGNHPPYASIEGCEIKSKSKWSLADFKNVKWDPILDQSPLHAGTQNIFVTSNSNSYSHLRLNIYPDGGVARLRVFGKVSPPILKPGQKLDLASILNGARVLACNDMFFGSMHNLLFPDRASNMGDGWETKRKRNWSRSGDDQFDWVIIELAGQGTSSMIDKIEIDTNHFKGNFPDRFSLMGLNLTKAAQKSVSKVTDLIHSKNWETVVEPKKLTADSIKSFNPDEHHGPYTHVKLCIYPDGGVSRLKLWGKLVS